jgi:hypothetical protein
MTKIRAPGEEDATLPSYAIPVTTPVENDTTPPSYNVPSTSTTQSFVYLEDIFERVQQSPTATITRGRPPTRVRPPTPDATTGSISVDSDPEDEAAQTAADLRYIADDFLSHHIPNTLPSRLQRDQQLQEQRLKHLDPEVLTAAIWGSYKTITAILNDAVDETEETAFRISCEQLLPFFSAFAARVKKQGFCQIVNIPAGFEHVDNDADFVILTGRDFLDRMRRLKAKMKAMNLTQLHGYTMPDTIDREDLLMAHEITNSIRLTIGGGTSVPAPFPAHVLRDVPAVQRFTEIALPGTLFLDHIPTDVELTRILFGVCKFCAGLREGCNCRDDKLEERRSFSPTYVEKLVGGVSYYVPPFLVDDFHLHVTHYELVYPGACFLFGKVPPAIANARMDFRVCPDCGIFHKINLNSPPFTMLPTPASLLCPYNTRLLAEKFVREFHQVESYVARPSIPYASGRLFTSD